MQGLEERRRRYLGAEGPERHHDSDVLEPAEREEPPVDRGAARDALGFAERIARGEHRAPDVPFRSLQRGRSHQVRSVPAMSSDRSAGPAATAISHVAPTPSTRSRNRRRSSAVPRQISIPRPLPARSASSVASSFASRPTNMIPAQVGGTSAGSLPAPVVSPASSPARATNVSASSPHAFHPSAARAATPIAASFVPPTQTGGEPGGRSGPASAGIRRPPCHGLPAKSARSASTVSSSRARRSGNGG